MPKLELEFESGIKTLSVRHFAVNESISELFTISVAARSPASDIELDSIVGRPASLRIDVGKKFVKDGVRYWTGVCSQMELVHAETTKGDRDLGESTYALSIVPLMWLLTQRTDFRVFQHKSVPDIVDEILKEWKIEPEWKIERKDYPKLNYKVQYGETDYDFVRRIIAEAGIVFTFPDNDKKGSIVTFHDKLHQGKPRSDKLRFVDNPNQAGEIEFATKVELSHEVRPGAYLLSDFDFRNPKFDLRGIAPKEIGAEGNYEIFDYDPGFCLIEKDKPDGDTPAADDKGAARHDPAYGNSMATRALNGERCDQWVVSFDTNTVDLWPGAILNLDNHPHPDLDSEKNLLITELIIEGAPQQEWTTSAQAVYTQVPYRSDLIPKPEANGVQSATVVGPKGEEIHTDEFGRVRLQFPWDRKGKLDENSSCWVRVSQAWAGAGYGMLTIPRVGQEVLVSFIEGDPDNPVITGRVFNAIEPVPYKLPKHKTRSTWRSNSSPGGKGFNEIMFEDLKGKELIYIQAQKDLRKLVKNDEVITVGHDRRKLVKNDEQQVVKGNRTEVTEGRRVEITDKNRTTIVGGDDTLLVKGDATRRINGGVQSYVGKTRHLTVGKDSCERVAGDCHIKIGGAKAEKIGKDHSLTVGGDQHIEVGKKHALEAGEEIHFKAGQSMVVEAGTDLTVKGPGGFFRINALGVTIKGNLVQINSGGTTAGSGSGADPQAPKGATTAKVKEPKKPKVDDVSKNPLGMDHKD